MTADHQRTRAKICGITRLKDAHCAVEAGADALGFVFHEPSPRYISPTKAAEIIATLPPFVAAIGVFVNRPKAEIRRIALQTRINAIQLHGDEPPETCSEYSMPVIKGFKVSGDGSLPPLQSYLVNGFLLDTAVPGKWGGTGVPIHWESLRKHLDNTSTILRSKLILAGGLNSDNVAAAINIINPFAVDVSTGVEDEPGIKNQKKIKEFMHAVRKVRRNNKFS